MTVADSGFRPRPRRRDSQIGSQPAQGQFLKAVLVNDLRGPFHHAFRAQSCSWHRALLTSTPGEVDHLRPNEAGAFQHRGVPRTGNDDNLSPTSTNSACYPGGLSRRVLPIWILLPHNHEGGTVHLVQPRGDNAMINTSSRPEGAPAPRTAQQARQTRGPLLGIRQPGHNLAE